MTRRDLQGQAKAMRRPWEVGKAFECSGPSGEIATASQAGHPDSGKIELSVNGELRQSGDLSQMVWKVSEIIASLSNHFELAAGDVIVTGTPAGVAPVKRGHILDGRIEGVGSLTVSVF